MAAKLYKAVVYLTVENADTVECIESSALKDYCAAALVLELDSEEFGNPHHVGGITIDWGTLEEMTRGTVMP